MTVVRQLEATCEELFMLLTSQNRIEHICRSDVSTIQYHPIEDEDVWKVGVIHEIMDTQQGYAEIDGFHLDEIKEILEHLCVS